MDSVGSCPQSTVHKGSSAREARESPEPSPETSLTTFRLTLRRVLATAVLATLALGVGGSAIVTPATAVTALPEPVVYTGVEYDGTGDMAERVLRLVLARDAAMDARLSTVAKATTSVTVQTGAPDDRGSARSTRPATGKAGSASGTKKPATAAPKATGKAATVVAYARAQVGKRYVWGASGPNTFDCSGLVKAAYSRIGISLPHFTGDLLRRGRSVSRSALAPGDLVFPSSGHVGIYVGNGQIVHASNPRTGVKISGIYSFYAARRIL